jgi:hypothetical protein
VIEQATALLAGAAGLFALFHRLRQEFSLAAVWLTTLLIAGGTSLFWSMTQPTSPTDTIVFAVVAALAASVHRPAARSLRLLLWIALIVMPLVVSWAASVTADRTAPTLAADPLFSSLRGFFALTPVAYIATVGLLFYARRNREMGIPSLVAIFLWTTSSWLFLTRMRGPFDHGLTPALALAAPGLATLIEAARTRPWPAVAPLVAAFPLWNYWLMVQYTAGTLPKDEPVSFAAMVRQQADVVTRPPFFYPFAFPANVFFAWREGVPVDRYELLAPEPRRTEFELPADRRGDRFLIGGWAAQASGPAAMRWTSARTSVLVFPLHPPSRDLVVSVVAGARADDPASSVEFSVEVNGREIGRAMTSTTPTSAEFVVPATTVREILRDGYNRLIIINHSRGRLTPLGVYQLRVAPAA